MSHCDDEIKPLPARQWQENQNDLILKILVKIKNILLGAKSKLGLQSTVIRLSKT